MRWEGTPAHGQAVNAFLWLLNFRLFSFKRRLWWLQEEHIFMQFCLCKNHNGCTSCSIFLSSSRPFRNLAWCPSPVRVADSKYICQRKHASPHWRRPSVTRICVNFLNIFFAHLRQLCFLLWFCIEHLSAYAWTRVCEECDLKFLNILSYNFHKLKKHSNN